MQRLGYERFVAQGGDWGNAVTEQLALCRPAGAARHLHEHGGDRAARDLQGARRRVAALRPRSRPTRRRAWDQLDFFFKTGLGYANEMALRPQTLYGDRGFAGRARCLDARSRRRQLQAHRARLRRATRGLSRRTTSSTTSPMYWLTNTAVSSARLYWDKRILQAVLRRQGRRDPGRRDRVPGRDLRRPAELGREGVSEAHPLQRASIPRRPFRRLGAAGAAVEGGARRLPVAALNDRSDGSIRQARRGAP